LLDEALLYVEWARGAGGPWLAAETPSAAGRRDVAPRAPAAALAPAARDPARWEGLQREVAECRRCGLCATRTQTVFGSGSRAPRLIVVGEAPGAEEDRQGLPFVGPAGEMLTKMLAGIGLDRERDVFILNVLKCRPPDNRPPAPDEVAACRPYLKEQIEHLKGARPAPPLLLALGNHAVRALLATERGITSLRGRFTQTPEGWRVMPTFHPAYLLRTPERKRDVWEDLKLVLQELGRTEKP
jgi:DNA polymerase